MKRLQDLLKSKSIFALIAAPLLILAFIFLPFITINVADTHSNAAANGSYSLIKYFRSDLLSVNPIGLTMMFFSMIVLLISITYFAMQSIVEMVFKNGKILFNRVFFILNAASLVSIIYLLITGNKVLVSNIDEVWAKQLPGTWLQVIMLVFTVAVMFLQIVVIESWEKVEEKKSTKKETTKAVVKKEAVKTTKVEKKEEKQPFDIKVFIKQAPKKFTKSLLAISVAMVIFGSFVGNLVQTDFYNVEITDLVLTGSYGETVVSEIYRPKQATAANPLPAVVVIPGFQRTRETQQSISIELARRGLVVITVDPPASGDSTASTNGQSASEDGYGSVRVIEHMMEDGVMPYVNKDMIGVTGHSAGGLGALGAASTFGQRTNDGLYAKSPVHSAYISGYVLGFDSSGTRQANLANTTGNSNLGMGYALYDEGRFRNDSLYDKYVDKNKMDSTHASYDADYAAYVNSQMDLLTSPNTLGDMRYAPESITMIESGGHTLPISQVFDNKYLQIPVAEVEAVYGQPEDRSLRTVYNEKTLHSLQPYHVTSNASILQFFEISFGMDFGMSPFSQVWIWKELATFINLVGLFLLLIPFAKLFMKIPFFKDVKQKEPAPITKEVKCKNEKWVSWTMIIFGMIVACISYIPMSRFSEVVFKEAAQRNLTWFFPARMTNGVMLWAVFNGLISLTLFTLRYKMYSSKRGAKFINFGIKTKPMLLLKTLLLGAMIFAAIFTMVEIVYFIWRVDFRFIMFSVKTINLKFIVTLLMYFPILLIYYVSNSIRVNTHARTEGKPEWKLMLSQGFYNCAGLLLILSVQYVVFRATGTVAWTAIAGNANADWLFINILMTLAPLMFILPIFNRLFFKETGKVWLGPIVMCSLFLMMTISNTVLYIPYL